MSILENVKTVADTVHEIKNMELYQRVLDIYGDVMKLLEENKQLHNENEQLQKKLELRGKMTFRAPFWYVEGDQTPYCASCWEGLGKVIHVKHIFDEPGRTRWDCPLCKYSYMLERSRGDHFPPTGGRPGPWS
jgi:hypothetical protein